MSQYLLLQLVVSFISGGAFITLLSYIAERSDEKIAGIVMMFPSTIVLGFFFLGIASSANHVASVVPATLIPLGVVIFSSVIYIYCALFISKFISNKPLQTISTLLISSIIWFVLVAPFAMYKFNNLAIGICGFFLIIYTAHIILHSRPYKETIARPKYTWVQIVFRALFTGSIIATVVFLGKQLNPFWGGIFTMYPAATFASLIIFHFYYPPSHLFYFMKKAPIGSLSIFAYAISVMFIYPLQGIVIGTVLSYGISLIISLLLLRLMNKT